MLAAVVSIVVAVIIPVEALEEILVDGGGLGGFALALGFGLCLLLLEGGLLCWFL
jgi:hypothetical protein